MTLFALPVAVAVTSMLRGGVEARATQFFPDTTEYYVRVLWWGESGSEPGQLNVPYGMGSDGHGNVYVCDKRNYRIQKFDSLGNFLMMFGEAGSEPGQFEGPQDVAVSQDGHIYVADWDIWYGEHSWVNKFDSLGNFVLRWGGEPGLEPGQLSSPTGIALGDSGYVYVADYGHRIQRFTGFGGFDLFWRFPGPTVMGGDVVGTYPGCVYTRWAVPGYQIFRYDPVGNPIIAFGSQTSAQDMATDSDGNLYVTHWGPNGRVSKYDSLGTLVTWWATLQDVRGIAVDAHDAVYVAHVGEDVISKWERRVVGVGEDPMEPLNTVVRVGLGHNYPNPFSVTTTIPFMVNGHPVEAGAAGVLGAGRAVDMRLVIYDVLGQVVRTLVHGHATPGIEEVMWDGTDDAGHGVRSGVYFIRLESCGETVTRKVVLIR